MKLIRFGNPGHEKTGIIAPDGTRRDTTSLVDSDYHCDFLDSGGLDRLREALSGVDGGLGLPEVPDSVRWGPPVARPGKIICIGLNYRDHAEETGAELPKEPVIFFKATTAYCGPFDPLILPRNSEKTDWEVELAVIVGKTARYIGEEEAEKHIAGYALHNDYSERAFQIERCGQWVKGKSCDTFAPLGPFLATSDEVGKPDDLKLWLDVNGERMQESNTSNLAFNVPHLLSYLSQFMTLEAGDIVSTGTPAGVGLGFDPPKFLSAGDVVELGIDGLGSQRQEVQPPRK